MSTRAFSQVFSPLRRVACLLLASAFALPVLAQEAPEPARGSDGEFENLEVLSSDMPRRELIELMKGYARALGVRCEFCHKGEPGSSLATFDFASDEKPTKETARVMIRMTEEINQRYMAALDLSALRVSCETCHRGQTHPRTLGAALQEALDEGGVESAIKEYRRLREESYGGGGFDFREDTLNRIARGLARQDEDAALRLLQLNLEYNPESSFAHFLSGEIYRSKGEVEKARASYRRALELDPDSASAARRLEELQDP
jgi:tetratricopeptide (TPR) repeat protein